MNRESRTCVSKSWSLEEATTSAFTERWKSVTSSGRSSINSTITWTSGWLVGDGVGDLLENGRLARARRRDDQSARALADGRDQVDDARLQQVRRGLQVESSRWGQWWSGSRSARPWCNPRKGMSLTLSTVLSCGLLPRCGGWVSPATRQPSRKKLRLMVSGVTKMSLGLG